MPQRISPQQIATLQEIVESLRAFPDQMHDAEMDFFRMFIADYRDGRLGQCDGADPIDIEEGELEKLAELKKNRTKLKQSVRSVPPKTDTLPATASTSHHVSIGSILQNPQVAHYLKSLGKAAPSNGHVNDALD
uniref:Uncharacterized protein n=1 Tax=Paramoeba aestuarina TaxID=180227 RepID=A0A7S4NLL5_9EUKA